MIHRHSSALLAGLAVAGTAALAWSQNPLAEPNAVELRVKAPSLPPGAAPAAGGGGETIEFRGAGSAFTLPGPAGTAPATVAVWPGGAAAPTYGMVGPAVPAPVPSPPPGFRFVPQTRTVVEYTLAPLREEEKSEANELHKLTEVLNSDQPAAEKEKARTSMSVILTRQFDRDVERREKEVVELEERVKKLREQVDRRKAAKEKIIGLRLDTIQNEADGLGFPATGETPQPVRKVFGAPLGLAAPSPNVLYQYQPATAPFAPSPFNPTPINPPGAENKPKPAE